MNKNLLLFSIFMSIALSDSGQAVSFYKENLVMKLDASHMIVTGEYCFRNNYSTDANQTVYFPLPLANADLKLDSISVFNESDQTYIRHMRKLPAGLFFQMVFHGQEQIKLRIYYVMDHNGKNFCYPVMTNIEYWKKPLSQGTYTLHVEDPSIIIDSTSYKPDEVIADNSKVTHTWRKMNFKPDKELDIWFHKKNSEIAK